MNYNNEAYEDEGFLGDVQETDGVIHGDEMGTPGSEVGNNTGNDDIAGEIEQFMRTPRFPGDVCVTLSMPDAYLKKARDKLNLALWNAHRKYARTVRRVDRTGREYEVPGFGMMDILLTLTPMVDPVKLSAVLDTDIKQLLAREKGISISDEELDYVAKHPGEAMEAKKEDDIVTCPECHGTGEVDGDECPLCLGQGKVRRVVEEVKPAEPAGEFDDMEIGADGLDELMDAFGR